MSAARSSNHDRIPIPINRSVIESARLYSTLAVAVALVGVFFALTGEVVAGSIVTLVSILWLAYSEHPSFSRRRSRIAGLGHGMIYRAVLATAAAVVGLHGITDLTPLHLVAFAPAVLILTERLVKELLTISYPNVANIPSARLPRMRLAGSQWVGVVSWITIIALLTLRFEPWGLLTVVALILAYMAITAYLVIVGLRDWKRKKASERQFVAHITSLEPRFVVYWDAPPGTEFQLAMWLPYLAQLDEPFFVIVRSRLTVSAIAALTEAPVVWVANTREIDNLRVPSLTTAFYVNNAARNSNFVRYVGITHVMLNHGDSDKAPSYNPVSRMYDYNFVAGQAAIDRFHNHGVPVHDDQFVITSRPQIERVETKREKDTAVGPLRVLYAPTWRGHNSDSDYSSLDVALPILKRLIEEGCVITFRPHPYTNRDRGNAVSRRKIEAFLRKDRQRTGHQHVFGREATSADIYDSFNASDMLLSDVSSVISDYLQSEKPIALVEPPNVADLTLEFPLSSVCYLFRRDRSNLAAATASLLEDTELAEQRRRAKSYYLGVSSPNSPLQLFLDSAKAVLGQAQKSASQHKQESPK